MAATEPTVMMVPPPCSIMPGKTAWISAYTPVRLTLMTASHSSCPTQRTLRALLECPALLMRMSTRPSSFTTPSTRARPCSGRETSPSRAIALPPAFLISATTASSGALRRPDTTTCAPSAASMRAVDRPIPVPPPVTIAIFPVSFAMRLLSPGPDGLFEMIHAGGAAVAHHLPHLIDHGGGGGVNEAAQDGQLYHRQVAFRNADEARHVRGVQHFEGYEVHARHLRRIRRERARRLRPEDHGSDDEAGARRIVIEKTELRVAAEGQTHFLPELTESSQGRALPRVDPAAGQRPLPGVSAQGGRALGEKKAAAAFLVGQQHDGHRRRLPSIDADRPPLEGGEVRARPPAQGLVEAHDLVRGKLASRGARLAHRPHFLRGLHGHVAAVAGQGHELISLGDHLDRVGGGGIVDARHHSVLLARLDDHLLRLHHRRIRLVEPGLATEGEGEIGGTDIDGVHSGHAQDVVEILQGLRRLDHG